MGPAPSPQQGPGRGRGGSRPLSAGTRPCEAPWVRERGLCRDARLAARGIPHGVTLRELGDMRFGAARERALAASGWTSSAPLLLKQVHGTRIELAGECREERPRADGWIVARRGLAAAVYVADCLPVFLWDDEGAEAVGVVHAGWRGLAAGVLEAAVRGFESLGIAPRRLAASVGPHAGVCCYRVGPELKDRFREESFSGSRLDLGAEARFRLAGAGLDEASIAVSRDCTVCSPRDFFSFRREKARAWTLAFAALP